MWIGKGLNEKAVLKSFDKKYDKLKVNQVILTINRIYFRPNEVSFLRGDSTKAKNLLGWEPKYSLDMLIEEMIEVEINK